VLCNRCSKVMMTTLSRALNSTVTILSAAPTTIHSKCGQPSLAKCVLLLLINSDLRVQIQRLYNVPLTLVLLCSVSADIGRSHGRCVVIADGGHDYSQWLNGPHNTRVGRGVGRMFARLVWPLFHRPLSPPQTRHFG
jgi:hypothetical protein